MAKTKTAVAAKDDVSVLRAVYADTPIVIDGKLDDAVWQKATAYPMTLSAEQHARGQRVTEGGTVRFAWNETADVDGPHPHAWWRAHLRAGGGGPSGQPPLDSGAADPA